MKLEKCQLATCPHCGTQKKIVRLISGNTIGAVLWSDSKQIAPMLPFASPLQKCPHCNHFYFMYDVNVEDGENYSMEEGWLNFEDAIKAKNELEFNTKEKMHDWSMIMVWAYNDIIRRGNEPTQVQNEIFKNNVSSMLESCIFEGNVLLKAELYREIGKHEQCVEILKHFSFKEQFLSEIADKILIKAKEKNNKVFILIK